MQNHQFGAAGLALTRSFEGLKLAAYADQRGVWTIGYGHTGPAVHPGLVISVEQAQVLLESDVAGAAAAVNRMVTAEINGNQFDALVDFAFNLGPAALLQSTLLRAVNAGALATADQQFLEWDHVRGAVVPGLLRRRQAEAALFAQP